MKCSLTDESRCSCCLMMIEREKKSDDDIGGSCCCRRVKKFSISIEQQISDRHMEILKH